MEIRLPLTKALEYHSKLMITGIIYFVIVTITSQIASKFIVPKYRKSSGILYNYIKLTILLALVIVIQRMNVKILHKLPEIIGFTKNSDASFLQEIKTSIFTGFPMFIWLGKDIKQYLPLFTFPF